MIKIRRAENRDIKRIKDLLLQVELTHYKGRPDIFREGKIKYGDEEIKTILSDENRPVFAAVDDHDTLVGYAFCIIKKTRNDNVLRDRTTLYVDDLCVDEASRGKRIGTALLDYVSDYARSVSCESVTLNVWACNEPAIGFYKAYGMKEQKIGMELSL